MKKKLTRNFGFLFLSFGIVLAIFLILFQTGILKLSSRTTNDTLIYKSEILLTYPINNTLFPPEIAAPIFRWKIQNRVNHRSQVTISTDEKDIFSAHVFENKWQPDSLVWEKIKKEAGFKMVNFCVSCKTENDTSKNDLKTEVKFHFSNDSVVAPLFFRQLDVPISYASNHLSSIEWCIGDISKYSRSKTLMTGVRMCGNCHSFSSKSNVLGIDFDLQNDKGGYASVEIQKNTTIGNEHFYSWNNLSDKGSNSSGFLSAVSPNGRYVIGTVNDFSITSFKGHDFLFFPVKGVIGVYDRETNESWELQGANDTLFVQCNATWSPDGTSIIFAKALALSEKELKDVELIRNLREENKEFRFDLWRLSFNNGKGGIATPIAGAFSNGKSNYFPKVSPDGKWIVFTQANSYMLRQLDSKLAIIPFEGGEARELESNLPIMNSWHSWSPNSKWIAFSTKGFSPYTKIALTHIDTGGHASPPVLLENFMIDTRAANIPEFVNINFDQWDSIDPDFLKPVTISTIDMAKVKDGSYQGKYTINGPLLKILSATVIVVVANGQISEIKLEKFSAISEKSKEVLTRILEHQSINLDDIGVNADEELVLVKAVEEGLKKGLN